MRNHRESPTPRQLIFHVSRRCSLGPLPLARRIWASPTRRAGCTQPPPTWPSSSPSSSATGRLATTRPANPSTRPPSGGECPGRSENRDPCRPPPPRAPWPPCAVPPHAERCSELIMDHHAGRRWLSDRVLVNPSNLNCTECAYYTEWGVPWQILRDHPTHKRSTTAKPPLKYSGWQCITGGYRVASQAICKLSSAPSRGPPPPL